MGETGGLNHNHPREPGSAWPVAARMAFIRPQNPSRGGGVLWCRSRREWLLLTLVLFVGSFGAFGHLFGVLILGLAFVSSTSLSFVDIYMNRDSRVSRVSWKTKAVDLLDGSFKTFFLDSLDEKEIPVSGRRLVPSTDTDDGSSLNEANSKFP